MNFNLNRTSRVLTTSSARKRRMLLSMRTSRDMTTNSILYLDRIKKEKKNKTIVKIFKWWSVVKDREGILIRRSTCRKRDLRGLIYRNDWTESQCMIAWGIRDKERGKGDEERRSKGEGMSSKIWYANQTTTVIIKTSRYQEFKNAGMSRVYLFRYGIHGFF